MQDARRQHVHQFRRTYGFRRATAGLTNESVEAMLDEVGGRLFLQEGGGGGEGGHLDCVVWLVGCPPALLSVVRSYRPCLG